MNYQKIYVALIEKAKYSNLEKRDGVAYEDHHIIPLCCNGPNESSNIVTLTCREHFIAHKLLPKIYKNTKFEYGLACAIWFMAHTKKYKHMLTSRSYQEIRNRRLNLSFPNEIREHMRIGQLGRKHSKESNLKISQANKGTIMCNNGIRNFQMHEPIPSNLCKGCIKKLPPDGMIYIHNDKESKMICINDELPCGYSYGYVPKRILINYKPQYIIITNGLYNKKIKITDKIPDGFKIGHVKKSQKPKISKEEISLKLKMANIGKIWANNGEHNIFQYPENIPDGYQLGRIKGKIWVTNGIKIILAYPDNIPNGYVKGRKM